MTRRPPVEPLAEEDRGEHRHEERRQLGEHRRVRQQQVVDCPEVTGHTSDPQDRTTEKIPAIAATADKRPAVPQDEDP